MGSGYPDKFSKLPRHLKPRFRIFLSADIVGSSKLKQKTPSRRNQGSLFTGKEPPHDDWLEELSNFFGGFSELFSQEWSGFRKLASGSYDECIGYDPVLWKTNGDEIIYVKHVKNRAEISAVIRCWINAVQKYRKQIPSELDIKATVWGAGFPLLNTELILDTHPDLKHSKFSEDRKLNNYHLLSTWYKKSAQVRARDGLLRDYLGPSVDTGFRLCGLATPRRMPISIELASLIADTNTPKDKKKATLIELPAIRFGGLRELKGVFGGKPYPHFWIDLKANDPLSVQEDKVQGLAQDGISTKDISSYCDAFFVENASLFAPPFIVHEDGSPESRIPKHYFDSLDYLKNKIASETNRYNLEKTAIMKDKSSKETSEDDFESLIKLIEELFKD